MKILTYKDLILTYIRQDYADSEQKSLIKKIFYNENSVFLYSKKFVLFLENEIDKSDNSREYVRFQNFVDKIQKESQKKGNVKSAETSSNFDEEFLHIFSTTQDKVVVSISCNKPNQEIQTQIPNIAVLSQQRKPNYHWLVVSLAILHPFTLSVDELDFKNNTQIDTFFDDLFSIPKKITSVAIFDDYYNVSGHNKYYKIAKQKDIYVSYYTVNHFNKTDYNGNLNNDKYKILKTVFPKLELQTKNKGSHTRRIVFEGFIVNPDIDLDMLNKKDNKMWSVHITFNESHANEIIKISNNDYIKFKPS